jgi:hypothetical protein
MAASPFKPWGPSGPRLSPGHFCTRKDACYKKLAASQKRAARSLPQTSVPIHQALSCLGLGGVEFRLPGAAHMQLSRKSHDMAAGCSSGVLSHESLSGSGSPLPELVARKNVFKRGLDNQHAIVVATIIEFLTQDFASAARVMIMLQNGALSPKAPDSQSKKLRRFTSQNKMRLVKADIIHVPGPTPDPVGHLRTSRRRRRPSSACFSPARRTWTLAAQSGARASTSLSQTVWAGMGWLARPSTPRPQCQQG